MKEKRNAKGPLQIGSVNLKEIVVNVPLTIAWILLILLVTNYWIANKKFNHE